MAFLKLLLLLTCTAARPVHADIVEMERTWQPSLSAETLRFYEQQSGENQILFGNLFAEQTVPVRRAKTMLIGPSGVIAETETDSEGRWVLRVPRDFVGIANIHFRLENAYWSIHNPSTRQPYEWQGWELKLPVDNRGPLRGAYWLGSFRPREFERAMHIHAQRIHAQYVEALDFLTRAEIQLDWWNRQLAVHYPARRPGFERDLSIGLINSFDRTMNLHELGHAIHWMGIGFRDNNTAETHFPGRCYNTRVGFVEGFANFFAAAVLIPRSDPYADLRASANWFHIWLVQVPPEVCHGDSNEWRVAAALWNLYAERSGSRKTTASISFARLWKALRGRHVSEDSAYVETFFQAWELIKKKLTPEEEAKAKDIIRDNLLEPFTQEAAPSISAISGPRIPQFAHSDIAWDGRALTSVSAPGVGSRR